MATPISGRTIHSCADWLTHFRLFLFRKTWLESHGTEYIFPSLVQFPLSVYHLLQQHVRFLVLRTLHSYVSICLSNGVFASRNPRGGSLIHVHHLVSLEIVEFEFVAVV